MKIEELLQLVEAIRASDFDEFVLEAQDVKLTLRRGVTAPAVMSAAPAPVHPAAAVPEPAPAVSAAEPVREEGLIDVLAPMVGTFYQAPAPGADPFVRPGSRIKPGDTLCILEAMKLMNEIEAEVEGEVVDVVVKNGELVEYGQVLMTVRPLRT